MIYNPRILFFGSNEDSVTVLKSLHSSGFNIVCIVTQPPKPIGRKKIVTPTPSEIWGINNNITVVHFNSDPEKPWLYLDEAVVINALSTFKAELLISASYGLKIPTQTIESAKFGGLNVHPSLLPRFRGADPIPWTILAGDAQAGVTIVTLSEKMDQGKIVAQKKIAINSTDTHLPLRHKLFELGSKLLVSSLEPWIEGSLKPQDQKSEHANTARRMKKIDGSVPWDFVLAATRSQEHEFDLHQLALYKSILPLTTNNSPSFDPLSGTSTGKQLTTHNSQPSFPSPAVFLDREIRALSPWPGVYTQLKIKGEEKTLKLISGHLEEVAEDYIFVLDQVQLEGKTPVPFEQFSKAYNIQS